ncbi:MAG TPA: 30S ribosomal protein S8 [Brevefilum fermentans]|jgi:small subunit ribosomal protein S8|uniref:Small ribosomal subunit protein uS8 n=1 Tax=Candidatus Brevifilum fermentans TaxID=1986204 RepID=A0A1Y6K6D8_9CHLR|nr:30S ribosomal protein S8 [Brevefilum fermentans]MDI9566377.1 30S ribosomal protein S8 [Chloroflexota bacterium]OQB86530.1 MAG: 30S ribosomal protein S8 [Chloroflexi bacterium ADurb.Bin120]SMX53600.1 30S ribosomal subunit protein S8 [Brevefilum fermentans]HOM67581.1 30S ribosomal protein S8 [Brevefilum fermentans]HPX95618.1 30S ribosomal protein S8 [Brevefilum fermentans]
MSFSDPIADMLTRIRNVAINNGTMVSMPSSKIKVEIAQILLEEGFIEGFQVVEGNKPHQKVLRIQLKYIDERRNRRPLISGLERVSRPGRRVYTRSTDIPWVLSGIGIAILSTPKGVMTDRRARKMGVGGEVLCKVW